MTGPRPLEYGWWLASRASGLVALALITLSVLIGLLMATRLVRRPAVIRALGAVHEHAALAGLVAIAVHGITLLGDHWLDPGIAGITVPFAIEHEPAFVAAGIVGGYLAAALGLSYYVRARIGARLWRQAHRATILVYALSVVHTVGAGTDASTLWLRGFMVLSGSAVLFLFLLRVLTRSGQPTPAFRRFRVADIRPESAGVLSFELVPADRKPVPPHEPGQFVPVRIQKEIRSYSLSSASSLRISVKRQGRVSTLLHTAVAVGDVLELGAPAGRFVLGAPSPHPLALISAGIGATPLLAMLESLARERSDRTVWWIHSARNGAEHAFRSEARAHLAHLVDGHGHVRYTRPQPCDRLGHDFDAAGRLTGTDILALGIPTAGTEFRLCGPTQFVADVTAELVVAGVDPARVQSESFGGPPAARPVPPPAAAALPADGPAIEFSRSGISAVYGSQHRSLLDVAEANAVPVASGCRIGACHGCRAGVVAGTVRHDPEPIAPPPAGSALLCCAVPEGDVVLDA